VENVLVKVLAEGGDGGGFYSLCLDIVANGSRGRCTAEGLFYHRNCPVPPRRHSVRRRRKKTEPKANGLPSEIKM